MTFTQLAVYAQYHDSELFHINAGSHRAFIFSTIQYSSMCVHMCVFTSVLLLMDTYTDFFFFFFFCCYKAYCYEHCEHISLGTRARALQGHPTEVELQITGQSGFQFC